MQWKGKERGGEKKKPNSKNKGKWIGVTKGRRYVSGGYFSREGTIHKGGGGECAFAYFCVQLLKESRDQRRSVTSSEGLISSFFVFFKKLC